MARHWPGYLLELLIIEAGEQEAAVEVMLVYGVK